ncbi:MAG: PCRF domain-containing protein [Ignavibacteriales bacterium]|nr:PCRF domain-containing protein [Ignavibacteriales bacterium]
MIQELQAIEDKYRQLTAALSDPAIAVQPQKIRDLAKERAELEPVVPQVRGVEARPPGPRRRPPHAGRSRDRARAAAPGRERGRRARRRGKRSWPASCGPCSCPRTPTTRRTSSWRSGPAPAATRPPSSPRTSSACTPGSPRRRAGSSRSSTRASRPIGGLKEAIAEIRGQGAYALLKYESGVHRVQRVPKTEAGRAHPHLDRDRGRPARGRGDRPPASTPRTSRSRPSARPGPGGQNVNRNYTAIRITHKPSGHRRLLPGREVPAPEQGEGHARPALAAHGHRPAASSRPRSPTTAAPRSGRASGARRSGPTTSPSPGSPTTG